MRQQGRITTWKDDKGFGFITPNTDGPVFVHISAFSNRQRRPVGNELVTFDLTTDAKGRRQATGVAFVGEKPVAPTGPSRSRMAPLFALCFLGFVGFSVLSGRLPVAVLALYLVASLITFFAYGFDKSAALRNEWRTRESTLHVFSLIGGWPGALAAQRLLRHKSAKTSFQVTFWFTVLLNCGALGWLLLPAGNQTLRQMLGSA